MTTPASIQLPEPLDIIAVGAHPDDLEIACGGTLAQLVKQGYRVGMVDLTDGEPTPGSRGPEQRLEEARKAAEILGVHERITLTLPNRKLFDSFETRVELAKVFRRYRPSMVLGILEKTPLASPDHWQAMQITDAAVFYSRLCKWDDQFDNLPVHRIRSLTWYPLGFRQSGAEQVGTSQVITDISDSLDQKLEAIKAYESQFSGERLEQVLTTVRAQNQSWGAICGFSAGELFYTSHLLGVNDLYRTVNHAIKGTTDNLELGIRLQNR